MNPQVLALRTHRSALTALVLGTSLLAGCGVLPWFGSAHDAQDLPPSASATDMAVAPMAAASSPEMAASAAPVAVSAPVMGSASSPARVQEAAPRPSAVPQPMLDSSQSLAAAATLVHGYYINVGLFAVPGNASHAFGLLEGAGLPVFSDTLRSAKKGLLTRVRVGPYTQRKQALRAAQQIHGLGLEAVVFKH